ncbi:MAG: vWA domain-containing protein [Planctomycetota bacterium]
MIRKLATAIAFAAILLPPLGAAEKAPPHLAGADEDPHHPPFVNPSKGAARVDAVFVLDSTGSMGGLIEGAKKKIWAIAQSIISGEPAPKVRFGLISYRDRGDAYITKVYDFSDDMDKVYGDLKTFQAGGGGDGPEHVAQALTESITKMSWDRREKTLRLVFLVGDAPPHTDYNDGYCYKKAMKMAVEKDVIINTVQCGTMATTTPFWKEIAAGTKGEYAAVLQSGGMRHVPSPFDKRIAEVSRKLGATAVAYGKGGGRRALEKKEMLAGMDAEAAAERVRYADKAAKCAPGAAAAGKAWGFGGWDLITALEAKTVKLEEVKDEHLPEDMKKMTLEERRAHVAEKLAERNGLKKQLGELSRKRDEFVEKKLKEEGKSTRDSFDAKVLEMLKKQAAAKGITYKAK